MLLKQHFHETIIHRTWLFPIMYLISMEPIYGDIDPERVI